MHRSPCTNAGVAEHPGAGTDCGRIGLFLEDVVSLSPELLALLVCPRSKAPLEYHAGPPEVLVCRESRLVYPVQDGIPIMLVDEATPLDDRLYPPAAA